MIGLDTSASPWFLWLLTASLHSLLLFLGAGLVTTVFGSRLSLVFEERLGRAALLGVLVTVPLQAFLAGPGLPADSGKVQTKAHAGVLPITTPGAKKFEFAEPISAVLPSPNNALRRNGALEPTRGRAIGALAEPRITTTPDQAPAAAPRPSRVWRLPRALAGYLLLLSLLLSGRAAMSLGRALVKLREIRRNSKSAPSLILTGFEPLRRRAGLGETDVLVSPRVNAPLCGGWIRQFVCLPSAALQELDQDMLETVMAHEIAHLRRKDPVWRTIYCCAEILLPLQPLLRAGTRRLNALAELTADQEAIEMTNRPLALARSLERFSRDLTTQPTLAAGLGARRCDLAHRVERILGHGREPRNASGSFGPRNKTRVAVLAACSFVLASLSVAALPPIQLAPAHAAEDGASPAAPAPVNSPPSAPAATPRPELAAPVPMASPSRARERRANRVPPIPARAPKVAPSALPVPRVDPFVSFQQSPAPPRLTRPALAPTADENWLTAAPTAALAPIAPRPETPAAVLESLARLEETELAELKALIATAELHADEWPDDAELSVGAGRAAEALAPRAERLALGQAEIVESDARRAREHAKRLARIAPRQTDRREEFRAESQERIERQRALLEADAEWRAKARRSKEMARERNERQLRDERIVLRDQVRVRQEGGQRLRNELEQRIEELNRVRRQIEQELGQLQERLQGLTTSRDVLE